MTGWLGGWVTGCHLLESGMVVVSARVYDLYLNHTDVFLINVACHSTGCFDHSWS